MQAYLYRPINNKYLTPVHLLQELCRPKKYFIMPSRLILFLASVNATTNAFTVGIYSCNEELNYVHLYTTSL